MMTGDEFRAWRKSMGWRQAETARQLDVDVKTIKNYESGRFSIPRRIELASYALAHGPKRLRL